MARKYVSLAELRETFKKARKERKIVSRETGKYAGLKECFKNVRKCNDATHLAYCYYQEVAYEYSEQTDCNNESVPG